MRKFITLALSGVALLAGTVAFAQPAPPAAEVTRQQALARGAEMFGRMDLNKDGKLDSADRAQRQQAMFDRIDTDHNGSVSRAEFAAIREQRREMMGERREGRGPMGGGGMPMRMGARADANNDGTVTREEFDAAVQARFERLDANKDGRITSDERRGPGNGQGPGMRRGMRGPGAN